MPADRIEKLVLKLFNSYIHVHIFKVASYTYFFEPGRQIRSKNLLLK